mgnify:CR=1 FL=1
MELEAVLLGLISMHGEVSGYDLNRIMRESTGYLISASLSHIYPSLKKLHDRGLVTFKDLHIKNRLAKKIYSITPAGETELQAWLREPVAENPLDFKPFLLKMAFSPLMDKANILEHIDREIERFETYHREFERDIRVEVEYLDKKKFDVEKASLLWDGINRIGIRMDAERLAWLKEWRSTIVHKIK